MTFRRVAVFGPGLLGASVALAARKRNLAGELVLWGRRDEAVRDALERGIADIATSDVAEAAAGADLLVIATPAGTVADLVRRICDAGPADGAIITDVASVKQSVVENVAGVQTVEEAGRWPFVGSHPMAGSEKSGMDHAEESLFEGRACILTPLEGTPGEAVDRLEEFWMSLGSRVLTMAPDEHDRAVARVSHLPHALAAVLVHASVGSDVSPAKAAGAGFRDTTRVASGPAAMWAEILLDNREAVEASILDTIEVLRVLGGLLEGMEREKLERFLEEARILRERALSHE